MATKEQIKKAILDLAGNPSSGAIASLADAWADAIVDLDKTPRFHSEVPDGAPTPALKKESRVTKPTEIR
jgi:hypothetical protein|tara:strand:- start:954 stop:1163 length:210 start_codon:yes stop_codon:yes gene_type:complete